MGHGDQVLTVFLDYSELTDVEKLYWVLDQPVSGPLRLLDMLATS